MRFYTQQNAHYCGIDLHSRTMYVYILNRERTILLHCNTKADPELFLKAIAPFREVLAVAANASTPGTSWPMCAPVEQVAFVLGHALYVKAITAGKPRTTRSTR